MTYRNLLSVAVCATALSLFACNSKSPETTESARAEGLKAQGAGLPIGEGARAPSGVPELDPPLPGLDGPHFGAFDLLNNRPLGHRIEHAHEHPTVAIDATTKDFVRYIQGTHGNDWLVAQKVDGGVVSATRGRSARLWMPALQVDKANVIEARVYNPARGHNHLTITLNGKELPQKSLEEGWQTVTIPVDPADALSFDNRIDVTFSNMGRVGGVLSGGGIAWMRIGKKGEKPLVALATSEATAEDQKGSASEGEALEGQGGVVRDDGASAGDAAAVAVEQGPPSNLPMGQGPLTLEGQEGLSWVVWIPKGAKLDLAIKANEGCGPAIALHTETGKGKVERQLFEVRELVLGRGEEQETAIDLSAHAGQVARLDLHASPSCAGPMTLERAALVVPGERPEIPRDVEKPKYILFWIIDTLRADYLPIHFETDVQAPNLKRLAEEGASFRVAYVQGTESRASHASLFTGQYPGTHGVMARGRVSLDTKILSQHVKDAGYRTGIIAGNGYVSHLLNLNRGWDHYRNLIHEETAVGGVFLAQQGLRWAMENTENPFFLYLGTIDPHVTYRRHEQFIGLYDKEPYHGRFQRHMSGEDLGLVKARKLNLDERDKLRVINLYKNEITFNDHAFAMVREAFEEAGIWEQTMVVVTSDHGEEFWEHGSVGHGHNVHQEMVHVPMIFYYPPMIPANTVVDAGADVIDIMPTVLDVLGKERPKGQQGKSVLPLIFNQHGGYPEPALATQYLLHWGLQLEDWKIYLRRGEFKVYDRRTDVLEMHDVAGDHPLATRWLLDSVSWVRAYHTQWDKDAWGVASNLGPDFLERIEGL